MKRIALAVAALLFAPVVAAQLYKYVDKDGKTIYTDQPPAAGDSKQLRVAPPAAPASGPKSNVERDKELQKGREAEKDKGKKAEEAAKAAEQKAANCQVAKNAYQHYQDGGRIYKYNAAGEREFMSDADIEAARAKSKRDMDEACKA